jgi:hypothetical protein
VLPNGLEMPPGQDPFTFSRRAGREPSKILVFFQGSNERLGRSH